MTTADCSKDPRFPSADDVRDRERTVIDVPLVGCWLQIRCNIFKYHLQYLVIPEHRSLSTAGANGKRLQLIPLPDKLTRTPTYCSARRPSLAAPEQQALSRST